MKTLFLRLGRLALLGLLASVTLAPDSAAQSDRETGVGHTDPRWHALVHATLVPEPGREIEDATIVVRDGLVVSVEAGGAAPEGARVWDLSGMRVYPAFVEAHLPVDVPTPSADEPGSHYYHQMIAPQRRAEQIEAPPEEDREKWRGLGFAAAAMAPRGGILRGSSAVVSLGEGDDDLSAAGARLLRRDAYQVMAFETAGFGGRDDRRTRYPNSEMGAIALARQTLADSVWYGRCKDTEAREPGRHEPVPFSAAFAALSQAARESTPFLFDARDELHVLRGVRLAREFDRPLIVLGSGTEYQRLDAIRAAGVPLVVPLAFPDAPDVASLADAESVSLQQLMSWEQAPTNLRRLVDAGLEVAITADKLGDADFFPSLKKALDHGLDEEQALAALTVTPARLLGMSDRLGRVAPGMLANLLVVDGPLFVDSPELRALWVGGRRHELSAPPRDRQDGDWTAEIAPFAGEQSELVLRLDGSKLSLQRGESEVDARNVRVEDSGRLRFLVDGGELGSEGVYAFDAQIESERMRGAFFGPDGQPAQWSAVWKGAAAEDEPDDAAEGGDESAATEEAATQESTEEPDSAEPDAEEQPASSPEPAGPPEQLLTPFGAYGLAALPAAEDLLIVNATIWTCGPQGIVEDGALLVQDGKVRYVGPQADAPRPDGVRVVDAEGQHLSAGLIDCHSHTGISRGVNESGERVTAEVRIQDVIDPDDINWYRQLAGGLTAVNQLHGSANAIGGQNSVVKLRWGVAHPDDMRLQGAKPGIKFALGENPKRVAQGTEIADEYPQTRMGVATLIEDRLQAGKEYRERHERYRAMPEWERRRSMPPRRDLELEALGEIVAGERLIHCHSYRQDEILMLCRIAQHFGFTIGTFQHVLEGYKVAETIRETALGGSTFSDWWAYKFEVFDAIPHNAALMTEVGVVVSINSDSSDFARRLNTEAAKGVKYGGMDPHEALKMVTLNPAIQLAVADRIGSLEPGKDADFVIWSGSPLSYTSRAEATYVDGREMFSRRRDEELREEAQAERSRLLQKVLAEGADRGGGRRRGGRARPADPEAAGLMSQVIDAMRAGIDPFEIRPGECGCDTLLDEAQLRDMLESRER